MLYFHLGIIGDVITNTHGASTLLFGIVGQNKNVLV
jgi:hypothetical protein